MTLPLTKPVEKPVMSPEQMLSLLGAITDLHDLCLMLVGILSGPRASEATRMQWKDTQRALRHASITTTGNVYVQVVEENVMRAIKSHAIAVLDGWTSEVESLERKGRNIRSLPAATQDT